MHETRFDLNKRRKKRSIFLRNLFYYQSNMTWLIQNANLVYVHNIRKKEGNKVQCLNVKEVM